MDGTERTLPRELAPGLHWLGKCQVAGRFQGKELHSYSSAFLLQGRDRSMLIETGSARGSNFAAG